MKVKIHSIEKGFSLDEYEDDTLSFGFLYPRSSPIKFLEIGMTDVRASDNIRVSYDFKRDGWKVEQVSCKNDCDETWQEVGFFPAWNLYEKEEL